MLRSLQSGLNSIVNVQLRDATSSNIVLLVKIHKSMHAFAEVPLLIQLTSSGCALLCFLCGGRGQSSGGHGQPCLPLGSVQGRRTGQSPGPLRPPPHQSCGVRREEGESSYSYPLTPVAQAGTRLLLKLTLSLLEHMYLNKCTLGTHTTTCVHTQLAQLHTSRTIHSRHAATCSPSPRCTFTRSGQ